MKIKLPIRTCDECGLPIIFGEYCIPGVHGSMHRRCAARVKMNRLVVEQCVHVQEVISRETARVAQEVGNV